MRNHKFLVDARGLKCPLPVLKAEKALALAAPGDTVVVLATDPVARIDIVFFCNRNGHPVVVEDRGGGVIAFAITRAEA